MSKTKKLVLITGAIFMISLSGCKGNLKYAKYESKFSEMNITVDYPKDWIVRDSRESKGKFAQALFIENKEGDFLKAIFRILSTIDPATKSKPATVESVSAGKIEKRLKYKDSKVVSDSPIKIKGSAGRDLVFSYKTINQIKSLGAGLVPAKERIVIFKRADRFFIISYENKEENFKKYDPAFNHMLKSIKFIDAK